MGETAGGVMLAVRSNIPSFRRTDIESDIEILVYEIRPKSRKKLLIAVFYKPPNSSLQYIKQFRNFLRQSHKAAFDNLIILGNFNLQHIDWSIPTRHLAMM